MQIPVSVQDRNKVICVKHDFAESLGMGWVDIDIAMYYLGVHTGIVPYNEGGFTEAKHIFWTDNPTNRLLYSMIARMSKDVLELDKEEMQVRWKQTGA